MSNLSYERNLTYFAYMSPLQPMPMLPKNSSCMTHLQETEGWTIFYTNCSVYYQKDKLSCLTSPSIFHHACIIFCLLTRFYVGCDKCQDWFHGTCVGISQEEADQLDTYVCPRCKDSETETDKKPLTSRDTDTLKRLLRCLQV